MRVISILLMEGFSHFFTAPLLAQDCEVPCIAYAVSAEVEGNWLVSADPHDNEGSDIQPDIELETEYSPLESVSLTGVFSVESLTDRDPGEDSAFKGLGLYVSELYASVDFEPVTLRVGRFSPGFSQISEQVSGISSEGFAAEYETDDRLAIDLRYDYRGFDQSHAITANVFTTDRTELSRSIGAEREILQLADGGAGNVSGAGSAALFHDTCVGAEVDDCLVEGEYGARVGIRYQGKGDPSEEQIEEEIDPGNELGILVGGTKGMLIDEDNLVSLAGEIAYFEHFEGDEPDAVISTLSLAYARGNTAYHATYSHFLGRPVDETDRVRHFIGLRTRVELWESEWFGGEQWTFDAAYNYLDIADEETGHYIVLKLGVEFDGLHQL